MATFDETARQACKVEGQGLTHWLDRFADIPFMEEGRQQPPMPEPKDLFE